MDTTGARYMSAQLKVSEAGFSAGLPDDQWIEEVVNWESYVWAGLQIAVADHALGPQLRVPEPSPAIVLANSTAEKALCKMQKMRKAGGFVYAPHAFFPA